MRQKKVIFSGGGTAGHLYPGLVVSAKLQEKNPEMAITFVGGSRELEKEIMERQNVRFIPLKIEGLKGRGIKIIKSLCLLPFAFLKSFFLLRQIKPDLVIGLGGYSSGPLVLLASLKKIPTLILEQNLIPGFTNRILISRVEKAVVAFEDSLPYFKGKGLFLGNPARPEFYALAPKIRNDRLVLLIFGGSQGSHFLNTSVVKSLPFLTRQKNNLKIHHQTGKNDLKWVRESYAEFGFSEVEVAPFFFNMPDYFQKSDLVICRAGATTVAELIASRKASLLIPFARATDNHQEKNANELKKVGGADVLLESEFTPETFAKKIKNYLDNKNLLDKMEQNLAVMRKMEIGESIAELCWNLMGRRTEEALR